MNEIHWGVKPYAESILKGWASTTFAVDGWVLKLNNPALSEKGSTYGFEVSISKKLPEMDSWGHRYKELRFVLDSYPACCAFFQLNHFNYSSNVKEEELHALLDGFFSCLMDHYGTAYKIVMNTVERQRDAFISYVKRGRNPEDSMVDEKIQTGSIFYPFMHSWAKKQKGCIDTPLINQNTSRIIHHMIVFPDVCQAS